MLYRSTPAENVEGQTYDEFLRSKIELSKSSGFEIDESEIHPFLKPHQKVAVCWAIRGGRRALFESFGLGKTVQQLEILRLILKRVGGRGLIVAPLGVRQEFKRDAAKIGLDIKFVRSIEECKPTGLYLTNYETVRDGKLDPSAFSVTSLDEAAILRGFGGTKTFREFMKLFESVPYRFVATATPDPNEYIELLAYAAYLGIMDVGQGKTRFFKRDSTKADKLTLHPHKADEFWLWVSSWALFLQKPSDLGFSDEGYSLPKLTVVHHEVKANHEIVVTDRDGQSRLFRNSAFGVVDAAREKRDSLVERIAEAKRIIDDSPDEHYLLWHDLEDERREIERTIPNVTTVYGSQDLDEREEALTAFSEGRIQNLAGKPVMIGSGSNFQYHCHTEIFCGIGFKFNEFIQGVHRCQRYLQKHDVVIHLIYSESEREILKRLMGKWRRHEEQVAKMSEIIKEYGLSELAVAQALQRSIGTERVQVSSDRYRIVNNDSVLEMERVEENSVGLILTSIPFCFDEKTEVLTQRGWTSFGSLTEDDELGTVNQSSLVFEWQRPYRLVWEEYRGDMLEFGNRSFSLLVTPNHRLWAARRGKSFTPEKLALVEAAQIADDYKTSKRRSAGGGRLLRGWRTALVPPRRGTGCWPMRIDIPRLPTDVKAGHGVDLYWLESRRFMELVGWYLSEGHCDQQGSRSFGRISIAQVTNEKKRREIAELFESIGLPPSWHSRQLSVWCRNLSYFLVKQFGHGSKNKMMPSWLKEMHPELLTILRDTMMKGDGATNGTAYISYSKRLRDDFQEICLKTGWRAAVKGNRVNVGDKQTYPEIRSAPKIIRYEGMIGCASVANGLLVVRRHGMACISGNSTQYEYTPSYNDFGHSESNAQFFAQMDYLTPHLMRTLKPGRIAAIHVKDRIVPGGINGFGIQSVYPFHSDCISHYVKHGFIYMGMKTIVTDVVRENNQTYRLGWTEQCKDATKMGYGMPEYLLIFRKPQTDRTRGYADQPVQKDKKRYSKARWQVDAHGFTRSNGNRPLTPVELVNLPHKYIFRMFDEFSLKNVYDFEQHVQIGESLEAKGRLPVTFMLLQPPSWHPDVWTDITRMLTANALQAAKGKQMHLCPMQFDLADRVITQMSNEGDVVLDPFAGLCTVPMRAVALGRFGLGIELNHGYFIDGVMYCKAEEEKLRTPSLFTVTEATA